METLAGHPHAYPSYQPGDLHRGGMNKPQFDDEDFVLLSTDPVMHDMMSNYAPYYQDKSPSQYSSLPFYPSMSNAMGLSSSSMIPQNFQPGLLNGPVHHDAWQSSPYSSQSGTLSSTFSDESSDFGWVSDSNGMASSVHINQTQPFPFAPLPSELHGSQHSTWSVDSGFTSPATRNSEMNHQRPSIALKELEFESLGNAFEQQYIEDTIDTGHGNFASQPNPEELDLTESIDHLAPAYQNLVFNADHLDANDEGMISTQHNSPNSEHEYNNIYGQHLHPSLLRQNVVPSSHSRTNSAVIARPARGHVINHSILDNNSRIRKGRSPKAASPTQASGKPRSRPKNNSKIAAVERSRGEKHIKCFPCTFHLFGCAATFGNKNEWKRHVYSQHLKLSFYRCDMGDCNPEYNPKLYVPSEKSRSARKREHNDFGGDEEKDVIFNEFNRKDLFTQHCRRMHGPLRYETDNTTRTNMAINTRLMRHPSSSGSGGITKSKSKAETVVTKDDEAAFELELEDIRDRCRTLRRKAPARTSCGFCGETFEVDSAYAGSCATTNPYEAGRAEERAWEDRMEHIGRHYERDGFSAHLENIDYGLVQWGLSVGILENVVDQSGVTKAWLVGCELQNLPIHKEESEDNGAKITGIRHKFEQKRAGLRCKKEPPASPDRKVVPFDSEEDASAEDD